VPRKPVVFEQHAHRRQTSSTENFRASSTLSESVLQPRQFARLQPDGARLLVGAFVAAREPRQPRIAADFKIVLRQQRQRLIEPAQSPRLPAASASGAQPLREIAAGLALEECTHIGLEASSRRSFRRQYSR